MSAPVVLIIGVAAALVATPVAIRMAFRLGVVDRPGELKPQARPVAYLGGVAVAAGVCVAAAGRPALLIAPLCAMALGLADDCADLPVALRVGAELALGVVVAATGHLLGHPGLAAAAVLATVGLTNAVNLVDGLDGLTAGVGSVAALGFAVMEGGPERLLASAACGALLGFLVFNRPPARVYLGDAGSYLVGVVLTELVVAHWASGPPRLAVATLLLVAYPAGELVCSIVRRRRSGRPLLLGDRDHTYDRLVARGWPVWRVSAVAAACQVAIDVVASVAGRLPALGALGVVAASVAVLGVLAAGAGLLGPPLARP